MRAPSTVSDRARAAADAVHEAVRAVEVPASPPATAARPAAAARWVAAAIVVAVALAAGLLVSRDERDTTAGWAARTASLATGWRAVEGPPGGGQVAAAAVLDDASLVAVGQVAGAPAAWVGSPRRWERADVEAFGTEGFVSGVAATRFGVVAVGSARLRPSGAPAIWRSRDGRNWHRAVVRGGAETGWVSAVAEGGPGLVAVGRRTDELGDPEPAVWVSDDGYEWRSVDPPAGGGPMDAVARAAPGLVAVGGGEVWLSGDGVRWSNRAVTAIGRLRAVAGHDGRVVAVGSDDVGGTSYAATWSSDDGDRWRRRPREADVLGPGVVAAVAPWEGGLVAMGSGPSLWASPDGRQWQLVRLDAALFRGASVRQVVPLPGGGLAAFGSVSLTATVWVWTR